MSLKKIKMTTTELVFPPNSGLKHTATSWQISKGIDFDIKENIIAESLNDTTNLFEYKVNIEVDDNTPLYGRHMMHISKNGVAVDNQWSRVCPFNSNMKGLKINNFMVRTPRLDATTKEGAIDVQGNNFSMFSGTGNHYSTHWAVRNSYGEDVFIRNNDRTNLTSLHVDGIIDANQAYVASAKYVNEFNNESFRGKDLILNFSADLELFEVDLPEDFIVNRKFYYRLKLYTSQHIKHDVEIRDKNGKVIKYKYNVNQLVDYFMLDNMTVYEEYYIYGRITFEDGKVTPYKLVYSALLLPNTVTPYKPFIEYLGMLDKGSYYPTDGMVCFTTRETYDGKIFIPAFEGDKLNIYQAFTNSLQKISMVILKDVYNFYYEAHMDHINILQQPNHDIIIDLVSYDAVGHKWTKFYKFEWNPIKYEFTLLGQLERPKEKLCTSVANSIGVLNDNTIVYVPGFYTESQNEVRSQLPLIIVDNDKFEIKETIELPFEAKYNVSLVVDKDDNIFIFGGSENNIVDKEHNNIEYWERTNNSVYKFDIESKTFEVVAELPDEWSKDIAVMQAFLRLDGKIAIFNATYSGPGVEYQDTLVFDPSNYTFSIDKTDMDWDIPFRSNVVYRNGNIGRVSYKTLDPQKSYTYISNTKNEDTITRIEGSDKDVTDLVVDDGKVVNLEDLNKYDSITIKGTGLIRWFRPQGIVELTSADLIVTRDRTMTELEFENGRYQNVLVLTGVEFIIESNEED